MRSKSNFSLLIFFVVLFSACVGQKDKEYEKISPSLREKIESSVFVSSAQDVHNIVVVLDKRSNDIPSNIRAENIRYVAKDLVHAVFISADSEKIKELTKDKNVLSIDEDYRVKTDLLYATKQIGARDVWADGYKGTYLGGTSSKIRLAVIDTGIDLYHDDFNGRIHRAVDCYSKTCTSSGQKDDHGHGTHVAGVVLGSGASCDEVGGFAYFEFMDSLTTQGAATPYYFPSQVTGISADDLNAKLTWDGATGTEAGVFFKTKHDAEEHSMTYIAPGPLSDSITEDGPGVTPAKSYSSLDYPVVTTVNDRLVPYAFSSYTEDDTLVGRAFWAYVRTPVKGWGDAEPRMAGVSYGSELVAVKALGATGDGSISDIVRALEYINTIAQSDNLVSVNLSFSIGNGVTSQVINDAVVALVNKGIIVVVSAGNDQERDANISSPGNEPMALTVGAVNELDEVTEYTSLGSPYMSTIKPDVLAPGGSRITKNYIASSLTLNDSQWNHTKDASLKDPYILKVGTSQAAPFVTGLVGLMASKRNGSWTYGTTELPRLFKMFICMSAFEVGAGESGTVSAGYTRVAVSPGLPERAGGLKDRVEGYGRVCSQGAMSAFDPTWNVNSTSSSDYFTFGDELGEQRSFIRKVYLLASQEYNFTMNVPSGADFDAYIFDGEPDDNGEPQLLASSALKDATQEHIIDFIPPRNGYYYLVSKWISGSGTSSFVLGGQRAKPVTPTAISNVSVYRDVLNKVIVAKWQTNVPARSVIQFGTQGGLGEVESSSEYKTDHEFRIDIDFGKKYYIRMLSSSAGATESDISTATTPVYKISTETGKESLTYDLAPEDLPSLDAGGCGTIKDASQNNSAWLLLLPIMLLLFVRLRLRYCVSGGKLDTHL